MATRINLGGEYTSQKGKNRHKFFVEVSNSLMNELQGIAMSPQNDYVNTQEVLADVLTGDLDIDEAIGHEYVDYSEDSD